MRLLRSRKFGYLVVLAILVQVSLLYWLLHDFVFDTQKPPRVVLATRDQVSLVDKDRRKSLQEDGKLVDRIRDERKYPTPSVASSKPITANSSSQKKANRNPLTSDRDVDSAAASSHSNQPALPDPKTTPQTIYWTGAEQLAEKSNRERRKLTDSEAKGDNIMFTIRTTRSFHQKRLPVLFETWINKINGSNFFLVTDDKDEEYEKKTREHRMHYIVVSCGKSYGRWSLCCKSGEEMSLMHRPENQHYDWFCHIDDDIYIIHDNLVNLLSIYDPKNESIYIGRAGSYWQFPRKVSDKQTLVKDKNLRFHFAVGGLYCLSRPMLNKVKPWLGDGKTMGSTCDKLLEPEDVTVAATVELLAHERLTRTKLFHPHGLILSKAVNPSTIKKQVGFAYGCGQLCGYKAYNKNAIQVPNAVFPFDEDPSRFKSIHCHLYPEETLCRR